MLAKHSDKKLPVPLAEPRHNDAVGLGSQFLFAAMGFLLNGLWHPAIHFLIRPVRPDNEQTQACHFAF